MQQIFQGINYDEYNPFTDRCNIIAPNHFQRRKPLIYPRRPLMYPSTSFLRFRKIISSQENNF